MDEYTKEDVLKIPCAQKGVIRDEEWHKDYFRKLGDIVINMLDSCEDIQSYLASELFPKEMRPKNMLPAAMAAE